MASDELFEVAINWAKKRGFKKIKANRNEMPFHIYLAKAFSVLATTINPVVFLSNL